MKIVANCAGERLEISVGAGKQHIRWLALAVATRIQREKFPHAFRVPQRVTGFDGALLRARQTISDVLDDGDEVTVELRQGAEIPEENFEEREWFEESYGAQSDLMECKFRWQKVDKNAAEQEFPKLVRGDFVVDRRWQSVYPQKDYGGRFEIPVEVTEVGGGDGMSQIEWIASRKGPPGSCTYRWVLTNDVETICKAADNLTADKSAHYTEFHWDVPIAPEPYPELDGSRPSTASSQNGAQVDPRFEQDWEQMRLNWVESFMKVRVKDVLTEFYAILIDLFDSYAFMGLDLTTAQHTIGFDDWKHLIINCGLLKGQPQGTLRWEECCAWYEEAAGIRDGRPYLGQRLTRAHFLELLMRTAGYVMCEQPRGPNGSAAIKKEMALDEAFFRFITDILIPVMDIYDDDPIRKEVVKNENLLVIQQYRPSIRSVFNFLSQSGHVIAPAVVKYVLEFAVEKIQEASRMDKEEAQDQTADATQKLGSAGPSYVDAFVGEDKLNAKQLRLILQHLDHNVQKATANHPEILEDRALLFWEFFEVLMQSCRDLAESSDTALNEGLPAMTNTISGFMRLVDQGEAALPNPSSPAAEDFDADS